MVEVGVKKDIKADHPGTASEEMIEDFDMFGGPKNIGLSDFGSSSLIDLDQHDARVGLGGSSPLPPLGHQEIQATIFERLKHSAEGHGHGHETDSHRNRHGKSPGG